MARYGSRFEWLQDYMQISEDIALAEWHIRKAEREENRWAEGDLQHVHLTAGSRGSHVLDQVAVLKSQVAQWRVDQEELLALVGTFDGLDAKILKLKYIDGMTLEQIAEKLHFSYITIARHHAELHRCLDFLDQFAKRRQDMEDRQDYIEPGK